MLLAQRLPRSDLYRVSARVARRNNLKALAPDALNVAYGTDEILITINDNGIMWVNRNFIAYALTGRDVNYVYITKYHIISERLSYRITSILRRKKIPLPEDIEKVFRNAEACMRHDKTAMWVDINYSNDIMSGGN